MHVTSWERSFSSFVFAFKLYPSNTAFTTPIHQSFSTWQLKNVHHSLSSDRKHTLVYSECRRNPV